MHLGLSLGALTLSLSSYHLNSHYNSSPHCRDWWAYALMHGLNGSDHVVRWQEWNRVSLVIGTWWICLANYVLWGLI